MAIMQACDYCGQKRELYWSDQAGAALCDPCIAAAEVNTLGQFMRAVQGVRTAGYETSLLVKPRKAAHRVLGEDGTEAYFLVIAFLTNEPNSRLNGDWWFDSDDRVMQVL